MTAINEELAHAAAQLVGTPFKLHGTSKTTGVDCVGLVICAMRGVGLKSVQPVSYCLRNSSLEGLLGYAAKNSFQEAEGGFWPGDIVLTQTGAAQFHLLIVDTENHFIHAHAGLRRVVRMPGPLPWSIIKRWRLSSNHQGSL